MKLSRLLLIFLLTVLGSGQLVAQIIPDSTSWTFETKKKTGDQYELIFHVKIKSQRWHIYSLKPGGDGMLIPPSFKFAKSEGLKLIGSIKEQGKVISEDLDGDGTVENFFKDKVDYTQLAEVKGSMKITGKYTYQVCTDKMCLSPTTKSFTFTIGEVAATTTPFDTTKAASTVAVDTSKKAVAATISATDTTKMATTVAPGDNKGADHPEMSLLTLFFISLGFGFAALLTPCVYSMIPITVSFFTKRSKTRNEGIRNATYYALSIILIFTILGVIMSLLFGPTALYKLSTNWIANLFFFAMFVVFGISFLGAFEITLPSSWTSKTDSKAGVSSFSGIFFMALTLVIVSFSCTGPIIGPLVVVAGKGGIVGPTVGMFGFSLGLALPFALFAVFPGLLNKMASSGGWLNQVKVVLGFIELGFALKFFSNADLVKHWRLLDREIFIAIWIVLAVLLGLYLLGKLKLSHDDATPKNIYGQEFVSIFKLFLAIISFTFAVYLVPGMWGAPLNGLGQFVPPMGTQDFVLGENAAVPAVTTSSSTKDGSSENSTTRKYAAEMQIYEPNAVRKLGLTTYFDYDEALAASKKYKKPLMVDFTGITCVNCRKMESQVWAQPEVLKRLKDDFIVVSMFCDATEVPLKKEDEYVSKETNEKITTLGDKSLDIQISKYKANSQPFYFFIDENETKLAEKGYGYDPDVEKFVGHLEKVKAAYKKLHP